VVRRERLQAAVRLRPWPLLHQLCRSRAESQRGERRLDGRRDAFQKFELQPGASSAFSQSVDPRLLATYEVADNSWHIHAGTYHVLVGQAADALPLSVDVTLPELKWSAVHKEQLSSAR
jgi:hypothetical protein